MSCASEVRRLDAGDRLPSSRELVERHRVSPITVSRAIALLAQDGVVESRPGSGTYVSELSAPAAAVDHSWQTVALADRSVDISGVMQLSDSVEEGVLPLGAGYLHSSLQPTRALAAAFGHAARLPEVWDRPPAAGLRGLRAWFAASAAPGIDAHDVIITPGGQGAISAAFRALVPCGAPLLVESPTYQGAIAIARMAGIRHVPVPTDAEGIIPDLLAEAFSRTGAQALYIQPTYQNPTGAVLSPSRRSAVLGRRFGRWGIRDRGRLRPMAVVRASGTAAAPPRRSGGPGRLHHLAHEGRFAEPANRSVDSSRPGRRSTPIDTHRGRHVRAPDDSRGCARARERKRLESPPARPRPMRSLKRSHALASAVTAADAGQPARVDSTGRQCTCGWPSRRTSTTLEVALAARRNGVAVMPGRSFFSAEEAGSHLRLTFTGVPSEADLEEGVRRLVERCARARRRSEKRLALARLRDEAGIRPTLDVGRSRSSGSAW